MLANFIVNILFEKLNLLDIVYTSALPFLRATRVVVHFMGIHQLIVSLLS